MTSKQILDLIDELLGIFGTENYFIQSLDALTGIAVTIEPEILKAISVTDNTGIINNTNQARNALQNSGSRFKSDVRIGHLYSEIYRMQEFLTKFREDLSEGDRQQLNDLSSQVSQFSKDYEDFLRNTNPATTMTVLSSAKHLGLTIKACRNMLLFVTRNLADESYVPSSNEKVLSIFLESQLGIQAFAMKLEALSILYEEIARVTAVSTAQFPLKIIKIESGSFWVKAAGSIAVIPILTRWIEVAVSYLHRNYTVEGKLQSIPKKIEATDQILQFTKVLEDSGIDTSGIKANVEKASVTISNQLNELLVGEAVVTINAKTYSIDAELRQKFLEESKTRLLESKLQQSDAPPQAQAPSTNS